MKVDPRSDLAEFKNRGSGKCTGSRLKSLINPTGHNVPGHIIRLGKLKGKIKSLLKKGHTPSKEIPRIDKYEHARAYHKARVEMNLG